MKKTQTVAKVLLVTLIIFAAVATFSSCNKFSQDEIARGYEVRDNNGAPRGAYWALTYEGTEYPMDDFIVLEVPDTTARRGISGAVIGTSTFSFPAQSVGGTVEIPFGYTKTDGSVDSVTVPVTAKFVLSYNGQDIFPLDSFVLTAQHSVLSSRTVPTFLEVSKIHLELRNQDGVLAATADGFLKIFEDPRDTIHVHDTTVVEIHDTVHHYDTTIVTRTDTVWLHDTTRIIQIDTVWGFDTVFYHDTIIRIDTIWWEDSTVVDLIHNSWNLPVRTTDSLKFSCLNQQTTRVYRNGQLLYQTPENFSGNFTRKYSAEGTISPSHYGMKLPFTSGQADFGSGLKLRLIGPQAKYTIPYNYLSQLNQLGCAHTDDSCEVVSGGLLYIGHDRCGSEIVRRTILIPVGTTPDTTTRRIVSRDTNWSCGSVTSHSVNSNSITHNITRTGVETVHYNVGTPLTVTNNLTQNGSYIDSYIFSGTVNPSLIGTTVPVTFSANGFSFSFGTATWTLTMGPQAFCQLQYGTTVTLTANGPELSWTYNGQVGYDTLNVNWYHPLTGKRVIEAWATYAYPSNTAAPEEWYVLYTEDLATGQRYFEYIPHTTGYITYSASVVSNSIAISSSDTVAMRNQINLGRYGARMYDHRDGHYGQWLPGFTHAVTNGTSGSGSTSTTSWTDTYWGLTGVEMNHVDLVVATTDSNSGNSRRGIGNGTYVEADNGRLYY